MRWTLCVTALGLAAVSGARAQPTAVDWSGLAWVDYAYTLSSDDPVLEGANSFDYRRIYLTADVDLHEDVRMRVRLEAAGRATTEAGRPSPFIKDAWIRWQYAETGHRATIGVQPPPLFQLSESVWGYRSLERTLIDRFQSSRDFGLRLDGPVMGGLRYAAMVGNGDGVRPEPDGEAGKHVYGQMLYSQGSLRASLGADYVARVPANVEPEIEPERETGAAISAFAGMVTERSRIGVEGFFNHTEQDRAGTSPQDGFGVSVFGVVNPTSRTSLIARYDFSDDDASQAETDEHLILAALAYRPVPALEILPNVLASIPDGSDPTILGRITVTATF